MNKTIPQLEIINFNDKFTSLPINNNFGIISDYLGVSNTYDKIITTQTEFENLISSSNWLGAKSVLFVGDGGVIRFTKEKVGITIPQTVHTIQGINNATIEILNFGYAPNNFGILQFDASSINLRTIVNGIHLISNNMSSSTIYGFRYVNNIINCGVTILTNGLSNVYGISNANNVINPQLGLRITDTNANIAGITNSNNIVNSDISILGSALNNEGSVSALYSCNNIMNSTIKLTNTHNANGGNFCKRVSNCIVTGFNVGGTVNGFINSSMISNCDIDVRGDGVAIGLDNSTLISNCVIAAVGDYRGYAIKDCSYINGCRPSDTPSSNGFMMGSNIKVDTLTVG